MEDKNIEIIRDKKLVFDIKTSYNDKEKRFSRIFILQNPVSKKTIEVIYDFYDNEEEFENNVFTFALEFLNQLTDNYSVKFEIIDAMYLNSGFNNVTIKGVLYASNNQIAAKTLKENTLIKAQETIFQELIKYI